MPRLDIRSRFNKCYFNMDDFRSLLLRISAKLNNITKFLSFDEWISLLENVEPSFIGNCLSFMLHLVRGGMIYEIYLSLFCATKIVAFVQHWKLSNGSMQLPTRLQARYRKTIFPKCVYWILISIHDIQRATNRQLLFYTFLADWKGLAQSGLDIFSKLGTLVARTSYHRFKEQLIMEAAFKSDRLMKTSNVVLWMDNYTHIKMKRRLRADQSLYSENQWTGIALIEPRGGADVDLTMKVGPSGHILPAVPKAVRVYLRQLESLPMILKQYKKPQRWDTSTIIWKELKSLPIRLDRRAQHNENLERVVPIGILDINSSSKTGLTKLWEHLHGEADDHDRYVIVTVDVALFIPSLRVISYSST